MISFPARVLEKYISSAAITKPDGFIELRQDVVFPRLAENEERWHGALLSTTSYGLLQCVFSSFDFRSLDPDEFMTTPRPFACEDALDYELNRQGWMRFKYYNDLMTSKNRILHESIAKYIAFLSAGYYYGDSYHNELNKLYNEFITLHSNLKITQISEVFGHPLLGRQLEFETRHIVYFFAKALLHSDEFFTLSDIKDREKLRACIIDGDFWQSYSPDEGLHEVLDCITREDAFNIITDFSDLYSMSGGSLSSIELTEKKVFNLIWRKLGKSEQDFENAYFRKNDLMLKACYLALNLHFTFLHSSHWFCKNSVDYTVDNGRNILESVQPLKYSGLNMQRLFLQDISTNAYYPVRSVDNSILELEHKEIIPYIKEHKPCCLMYVPIPVVDDETGASRIDAYIYSLPSPAQLIGIPLSTKDNVESWSLLVRNIDVEYLVKLRKSVPLSFACVLFYPPPNSGFRNYKLELASRYSQIGPVVCIEEICNWTDVVNSNYVDFADFSLSETASGAMRSGAQTFRCLMRILPYEGCAVISCVPNYYKSLFQNIFLNHAPSAIMPKNFDGITDQRAETGIQLIELIEACEVAFRACYTDDVVTSNILKYGSLEDLWTLVK